MNKMHEDSIQLMKIGATLTLCFFIVVEYILWFVQWMGWIPVHPYVYTGIVAIALVLFLLDYVIFPKLTYDTTLYALNEEEIITLDGVFNKEKLIVPYITIQNVELEQGPIMKRYHIKSLRVITAENSLSIKYIHEDEAEQLKMLINQKMRAIEQGRQHD